MTRYFCDLCDRDMTLERYERYSLTLHYSNGRPDTKERHMGLICADCVGPILSLFDQRKATAAA